jgi:hypothetical protein
MNKSTFCPSDDVASDFLGVHPGLVGPQIVVVCYYSETLGHTGKSTQNFWIEILEYVSE